MSDELTKEEIRQLKLSRAMQDLVASASWKAYVEILNGHCREWNTKLLTPTASLDGVLASEFAKGAVYGLSHAMSLPDIMIQVVKDQILSKDPADKEATI